MVRWGSIREAAVGRYVTVEGEEARVQIELGNGPTTEAVWEALPIQGGARPWGEEIYLPIPVSAEPGAGEVVEVGDVACWPAGEALCLFFRATPASSDERPRAASAVNVIGHVVEGLEHCPLVSPSETLTVSGLER